MRPLEARAPRRFRRGVSIIPSVFTIGNLFCGFVALVRTLDKDYAGAAPLLIAAIILDVLDGRIARLTATASEFGGELDSLADAISFGVAPAVLAYSWALGPVPRIGWLTAFLFVVCGVSRLARFNVQRHVIDGRYFVGLPIPAAAGQIAALVLVFPARLGERLPAVLVAAMTVCLALLMVSTFRYPSFKSLDLRSRRSYLVVLVIALVFLLVAIHPEGVLLSIGTLYALWGPSAYLVGLVRRRGGAPQGTASGTPGP
jgi:CDP-diacylglycerol--serine O-phosphatidyltransferase